MSNSLRKLEIAKFERSEKIQIFEAARFRSLIRQTDAANGIGWNCTGNEKVEKK